MKIFRTMKLLMIFMSVFVLGAKAARDQALADLSRGGFALVLANIAA